MIAETLTNLANDVERLLLAGAAVAAADERLPEHAGTLRRLGQRLPALLQLAEAVERIPGKQPTEAAAPLLDLLVLVRQLRANLATAGQIEGGPPGQGQLPLLTELKESGPWESQAPISELLPSIDNDYYRRTHVGKLRRVLD